MASTSVRGGAPVRPFGVAGRRPLVVRRRQVTPYRASAEAEQLLADGKAKYDGGDRMGGLRLFEQALQRTPTQEQRVAALFNAAAVHASFGDLELAQIPLKEAIFGGLDFPSAMQQADPRYVKLKASAQVLIQMRKFNEAVLRAKAAGPASPPASTSRSAGRAASGSGGSSARSGGLGGLRGLGLNDDMSEVLSTDAEGIDASIAGIAKRVVVLLLGLSGLGTVLFYLGLKYAFPDSIY
ncbi:hypothetical protein C2E20_0298 [Micractinium conductrix]|uniref:Uncharacterized protein n=1 Tax=Micractinium conductrix TaxID=554055 RepID=A0A2P6VQG0_9CHLO|nr:hypothetical protein C2E20_0298 [Micractinium conductrix]|eukprot:PSC76305.1 hypothetical protein C2E20_0298 [Micractinium conductrix]